MFSNENIERFLCNHPILSVIILFAFGWGSLFATWKIAMIFYPPGM